TRVARKPLARRYVDVRRALATGAGGAEVERRPVPGERRPRLCGGAVDVRAEVDWRRPGAGGAGARRRVDVRHPERPGAGAEEEQLQAVAADVRLPVVRGAVRTGNELRRPEHAFVRLAHVQVVVAGRRWRRIAR